MKKISIVGVLIVVAMGVTSAFAGGMPKDAGKKHGTKNVGKPLSKDPNKGTFQASADHIAHWGASNSSAKQQSLRGNKEELAKRRGMPR